MKNIFKTLYIHGLDSSPKKNKLNIIKKKSTDFSFHLDYRNEKNTFKILSNCIKENNINSVIGSSFGGMLGYWLSKKHKIPSLLFNPAMHISKDKIYYEISDNKSPLTIVILGKNDEIVNPIKTKEILQKSNNNIKIIECDIGHKIDLITFKTQVDYFFKLLNNNKT
tara:strand:- start:506 stop:1006 length:501 start_codon:yes stop_codon:yes gene_type:complete